MSGISFFLPIFWYLSLIFGDPLVFSPPNADVNIFTIFYLLSIAIGFTLTYRSSLRLLASILTLQAGYVWIFIIFALILSPSTFPIYICCLCLLASPKSIENTFNLFSVLAVFSFFMSINQLVGIFPQITIFTSLSNSPSLPLFAP